MPLPNFEEAYILRPKVTEYLLKFREVDDKSAYFLRFGFALERPEELEAVLLTHAQNCPLADSVQTPFGTRYLIVGPMETPDGCSPNILAVWQIDSDATAPHLVTAYRNNML